MNWIKRYQQSRYLETEQGLRSEVKRLQREVKRFDRVFRGSYGYGFLDWNLPEKKLTWDFRFWESLGYAEVDMENISDPAYFLEYVHPDDKQTLKKTLHSHLRGHGPDEAMFRIRKKRGGHIWAEIRVGSVRDDHGWVKYMSGIVLDVTKLKQTEQALLISEARHARIIQSSNDGIWEWSAESGGFHFSNRCWEHLGYTDHDDVVNHGVDRVQAWRSRMHPDDGLRFDQILQDHIAQRGPFDVEYRIKGKDDAYRWIRARGQMTYNSQGKPSRMSGTNMDITALKRAEERVLKAKESAEEANRAKSEFLSSMSHELRTPLNAILGFAQLFDLDVNLTRDQLANILEIKKAGEHLLELVSDVLDLSKIEAGKMTFVAEYVAPVRMLLECESLLRSQAEMKNVRLDVEPNDLDDVTIRADSVRLRQVLINLISNAIKYNFEKGVVHLSANINETSNFRITVADSGRGISLEKQKELFQPFNRLGAEHSGIEGSGVGLVITKQLVENMGGTIGFESKEGVGSRFWVDFPVALHEDSHVEDELASHWGDSSTLPELLICESKNILYIEDNPPNQRLMNQLLARFPLLNLEIAEEALRGIFVARTRRPDLIILDINLPGMDGYETVNVLRQDPETKNIPVIALSANALPHDLEKGEKAGFDQYLTKPVNLGELIQAFNTFLSKV